MSTIAVNTITNASGGQSVTVADSVSKAGGRYDMTGTAAIETNSDHNITSLTDEGTGIATLTLSNAMNAADSTSAVFSCGQQASSGNRYIGLAGGTTTISTTAFALRTNNTADAASDEDYQTFQVFGDLA